MKKAIIAFTVLLVLSLISTVCFAAATGTRVLKSAVEYFADNGINGIEDIDTLEEKIESFARDKMGIDLDVHVSFNNEGKNNGITSQGEEITDLSDEPVTQLPELTETTTEEPVSE